jgi:hypothetical protein
LKLKIFEQLQFTGNEMKSLRQFSPALFVLFQLSMNAPWAADITEPPTPPPCFIKECQEPAEKVCGSCNKREPTYFCNTHFAPCHSRPPTRGHYLLTLKEFNACQGLKTRATDERLTRDNKENLFLSFAMNGKEANPGKAFYKMYHKAPIQGIVGFVGPTGAGKSFLTRYLTGSRDDGPFGAEPGSFRATSSDLHAYERGEVIFFDPEGFQGCMPKQAFLGTVEDDENNLEYRGSVSQRAICLARVLYPFSDITCYVYGGSVATVGDYVENLLSHGKAAASACVNNVIPDLIIIFNKADATNKNYFAFENPNCISDFTELWQNANPALLAQLKKYYGDIRVMLMPNIDNHRASLPQLNLLGNTIDEILAVRQAKRKTLKNPNIIAKMKSMMDRLIENTEAFCDQSEDVSQIWAAKFLDYYERLKNYYDANPDDTVDVDALFKQEIEYVLYLTWKHILGEQMPLSPLSTFDTVATRELPALLPTLLKQEISERLKCNAVECFNGKMVKCDVLWPWHEDLHKSIEVNRIEGKGVCAQDGVQIEPCMWPGSFERKSLGQEMAQPKSPSNPFGHPSLDF